MVSNAESAYRDPIVEAYKKGIDRTLLRVNLKLTVTERFRRALAHARFASELRRAGEESCARWCTSPAPTPPTGNACAGTPSPPRAAIRPGAPGPCAENVAVRRACFGSSSAFTHFCHADLIS